VAGTISWLVNAVCFHLQKDPLMEGVRVIHVVEALYCISVHLFNLLIQIEGSVENIRVQVANY